MSSNLFNEKELQQAVEKYPLSNGIILKAKNIFTNFSKENLSNEETQQAPYLMQFFGDILGYIHNTQDKSLWWESGSKVDSKKPDGILGFNVTNYRECDEDMKGAGDIRVVIELKDDKKPLDKSQNRVKDNRTPVEQAFGYASKVGGKCEWVIVSNFRKTRLYRFGDESKYHEFDLEELANDDNKIKEFHFLLGKGTLFTAQYLKSPIHNIILDIEERKEEIQEKFIVYTNTTEQH